MFPVLIALILSQSEIEREAEVSGHGYPERTAQPETISGATNPRSNIDQAFLRRFNVIIVSPPPPPPSGANGESAPPRTRDRNLVRDGRPPAPRLPPRPL